MHTPVGSAQALESPESLDPLRHGPFRRLARHPAATELPTATAPFPSGAIPPAAATLTPVEVIFPVGVVVLYKQGPDRNCGESVGRRLGRTLAVGSTVLACAENSALQRNVK